MQEKNAFYFKFLSVFSKILSLYAFLSLEKGNDCAYNHSYPKLYQQLKICQLHFFQSRIWAIRLALHFEKMINEYFVKILI
ncbi:MAG: hypothetical protein NEHIOOID_00225 [Holosporales bacterium]